MKPQTRTIFYLEIVINEIGLKFLFGVCMEKRFHKQMNHVFKILEILSLLEEISFSLY